MVLKTVKLTNKQTGEIIEIKYDPSDPTSMRDGLLELKSWDNQIIDAKELINKDVDRLLGEERGAEVGDWRFLRVAPVTMTYQFETVSQYIDQDLLISYRDEKNSPAIKVQSGPLKKLMAELVTRGELAPGTMANIEKTAEHKATKPYIKLERITNG